MDKEAALKTRERLSLSVAQEVWYSIKLSYKNRAMRKNQDCGSTAGQ